MYGYLICRHRHLKTFFKKKKNLNGNDDVCACIQVQLLILCLCLNKSPIPRSFNHTILPALKGMHRFIFYTDEGCKNKHYLNICSTMTQGWSLKAGCSRTVTRGLSESFQLRLDPLELSDQLTDISICRHGLQLHQVA